MARGKKASQGNRLKEEAFGMAKVLPARRRYFNRPSPCLPRNGVEFPKIALSHLLRDAGKPGRLIGGSRGA